MTGVVPQSRGGRVSGAEEKFRYFLTEIVSKSEEGDLDLSKGGAGEAVTNHSKADLMQAFAQNYSKFFRDFIWRLRF